jgi:hypothetical protein
MEEFIALVKLFTKRWGDNVAAKGTISARDGKLGGEEIHLGARID